MNTIKVFKWWWGWNSEPVENWLENMEVSGLTLDKVGWFGTRFHFVKGSGQRKRYCIDYQPKLDREYINLIHDDGWELIPMGAGWYVCRKEYDEGQKPQLYTDYDSLMMRNKKLFSIVLACSIPTFAIWHSVIRNENLFFTVLWALLCVFYLFSLYKLKSSNDLLKKMKEFNHR